MKLLFIHHRFPGQFKTLVEQYAGLGSVIIGICQHSEQSELNPEIWQKLTVITYGQSSTLNYNHAMLDNSVKVRAILVDLKIKGFLPDYCFAHIGFGDSLFVKDVFPESTFIAYCEYFYHSNGLDAGYDPEFSPADNAVLDMKTPNAYSLLALNDADAAISPTYWQKHLFPAPYQPRIDVIHEGVDINVCAPDSLASYTLPNGLVFRKGSEVVTYATRNLEPYRGFHHFMRAAAILLEKRPGLHIIVVGGDEVSYSLPVSSGKTYRQLMMNELQLDETRIHFVGRLPFTEYCRVLNISMVHVYLTVPFVLSWSLLEAMATGCSIVSTDTHPVREFLSHGDNALLTDFFQTSQLAACVEQLMNDANLRLNLSVKARQTIVEGYTRQHSVLAYQSLLERIRPIPAPVH